MDHPPVLDGGRNAANVEEQSMALHLIVARCTSASTVQVSGVDRKAAARIRENLEQRIIEYVKRVQQNINFGDESVPYTDLETDEVTYACILCGGVRSDGNR
eukprot:2730904-Amphidinium_carterae.1